MNKTPDLVTVREMCDIFQVDAGALEAMTHELRNDGIEIFEDWAGRPAIAFADAKRKVDRVRKQTREFEEQREREILAKSMAHDAQKARNEIVERVYSEQLQRELYPTRPEAQIRAYNAARQAALAAEVDLPKDIQQRLGWLRPGVNIVQRF